MDPETAGPTKASGTLDLGSDRRGVNPRSSRYAHDDVTHWRERGDEARSLVSIMRTSEWRSLVLMVAESCDRLADQALARRAWRARLSRQSLQADQ
jgi:hypothetical protein